MQLKSLFLLMVQSGFLIDLPRKNPKIRYSFTHLKVSASKVRDISHLAFPKSSLGKRH